jgi:hypothetical protein
MAHHSPTLNPPHHSSTCPKSSCRHHRALPDFPDLLGLLGLLPHPPKNSCQMSPPVPAGAPFTNAPNPAQGERPRQPLRPHPLRPLRRLPSRRRARNCPRGLSGDVSTRFEKALGFDDDTSIFSPQQTPTYNLSSEVRRHHRRLLYRRHPLVRVSSVGVR